MELDQVQRVERNLILDGTVLRFYQDRMRFPDGNEQLWDIVEHKYNASAVIPILPDGRILLVNQYRSTCDRTTWEIPAGKKDEGEDYLQCIKRELIEETGYTSDKFNRLFTFRCAIAYSTEIVEVYRADDVYRLGEQQLDEDEFINIKAWQLSELTDLISKGVIEDSKTIAAIYAVAVSSSF